MCTQNKALSSDAKSRFHFDGRLNCVCEPVCSGCQSVLGRTARALVASYDPRYDTQEMFQHRMLSSVIQSLLRSVLRVDDGWQNHQAPAGKRQPRISDEMGSCWTFSRNKRRRVGEKCEHSGKGFTGWWFVVLSCVIGNYGGSGRLRAQRVTLKRFCFLLPDRDCSGRQWFALPSLVVVGRVLVARVSSNGCRLELFIALVCFRRCMYPSGVLFGLRFSSFLGLGSHAPHTLLTTIV